MNLKKGKVISVTSSKGGVGKTIITLNLASVFAKLNLKVLVIDFDLYNGAIATYLNSTSTRTIYNLVEDLAFNRYDNFQNYIFSYDSNIDVIASPQDPREASKIDTKYIPLIINNVIFKYDIILLDTYSILNEVNITCLDNSDYILYVFTKDLFDLKNTKSFFSIIEDAKLTNIYTILNEAIYPTKTYFSYYDIRNIIKRNIDFTISKYSYIKNIDKYLIDGKILIENKSCQISRKDVKVYNDIAKTILKGGKQ